MFYLYLKTHNTTGLKYLGQTKNDPQKYKGSGLHWKRHLEKHGYDVTTTILYETPFKEEIKEQGLYFSDLWNIVESKEFANMMIENGVGLYKHTKEAKLIISKTHKGKTLSDEHKIKIGESSKGRIYGEPSEEKKKKIGNANRGKIRSEEHKRKMSELLKGIPKSEEHKQKLRIPKPKITCPHCGKTGGVNVMPRYHFDNCKNIQEN